MNIARILYPVKVLGIGKRVGIWVCGCSRKCNGCSNPELWARQPKYEITLDNLKNVIGNVAANNDVDGFTITGGEPFEQAEELSELIPFLKLLSEDILIYTGYSLNDLRRNPSGDIQSTLDSISVLIDGEYIEEHNTNVPLRGSDNQRINILDPKYEDCYRNYFETEHNQIQNFTTTDGVVSVGIHRRNFASKITKRVTEKKGETDNV